MNTKKDIMKIIEEEDVEFIRLQFTDVWGNLKNIAVTPGQMKKVMDNMYSFESSALFNDVYEYNEDVSPTIVNYTTNNKTWNSDLTVGASATVNIGDVGTTTPDGFSVFNTGSSGNVIIHSAVAIG